MTEQQNNDSKHKYSTSGSSLDRPQADTDGSRGADGSSKGDGPTGNETSSDDVQKSTVVSDMSIGVGDPDLPSEYLNDALVLGKHTTMAGVRAFLLRRVNDPIVIDDTTIWYFNNHKPDMGSLMSAIGNLRRDEYVVPYQVTSVWGAMCKILPDRIGEAEILLYSPATDEDDDSYYFPRHNFAREEDQFKPQQFRNKLSQAANDAAEEAHDG